MDTWWKAKGDNRKGLSLRGVFIGAGQPGCLPLCCIQCRSATIPDQRFLLIQQVYLNAALEK